MPYGLPRELDTPQNNAKMERCVQQVMSEGNDKVSAIKICKANLIRSSGK